MGLSGGEISILDALIISVIGMLIVFAVLIILMAVVMLMGLIAGKAPALPAKKTKNRFKKKKHAEEGGGAAPPQPPPPPPRQDCTRKRPARGPCPPEFRRREYGDGARIL